MKVRHRSLDEPTLERLFSSLDAEGLAFLDANDRGRADRLSRHVFLAAAPVETHRLREGASDEDVTAFFEAIAPTSGGPPRSEPLDELDARAPRTVLLLAYDLGWQLRERIGLRGRPRHPRRAGALTALAHRYDAVLAVDRESGEAHLVGDDIDAIERLGSRLDAALSSASRPSTKLGPLAADDPARHRDAITRALEHILDGDVYQINLARRFTTEAEGDLRPLFLAMRAASPVPFGAYVEDAELTFLSRSMELFLRTSHGTIETRPIKGTLARDGESDGGALVADAKEHAEHAMIVDLMRNDLSRLSRAGSVEVVEPFRVEPYARLFHLVSTVRGVLRDALVTPRLDVEAILAATFPPGSITGTPRLRAMELIEELEPASRRFYTGAHGHLDRGGELTLSVSIRTAVREAGALTYWAGGGIVEASDVARELAETELKTAVLRDALDSVSKRGTSGAP